jgi:hypothetical protein
MRRQVERLCKQIKDPNDIATAPVTIAPNRRATDQQIAGRHVGTPVLAWQAENRASFILDKLSEGYTNDQLLDRLGFTLADIQAARQIRAIADMARSLDLPEEIKAKIENPRAKLFTTLERVFESSVGREHLMVKPDPDYGLVGTTTKDEFLRGFKRLVTDIALGRQSSRTLNKNEDIQGYFNSWKPGEHPTKKPGSFIPEDVIKNRPATTAVRTPAPTGEKTKRLSKTILPRDFRVRYGNDRLVDIRSELVRLKREKFPNVGAVLLRVFFELAVTDYFERTGELSKIIEKIERKEKHHLPFGKPTMRQLAPEIKRIAKNKLKRDDAIKVEKAIRYDPSAPFTISELHGFVHHDDLPSARDILQFWDRTEPLFRLMLEQDVGDPT